MNEGRLFLYVSPKVALPGMFLVLILTALIVHAAILYNTTWFAAIWQGGHAAAVKAAAAPAAAVAPAAAAAPAMADAAPAATGNAAQ
jgi:light-harvesting protein B-800-850 alpha chain